MVVGANLAVDLAYRYIDPRFRTERRHGRASASVAPLRRSPRRRRGALVAALAVATAIGRIATSNSRPIEREHARAAAAAALHPAERSVALFGTDQSAATSSARFSQARRLRSSSRSAPRSSRRFSGR